ncbi:hypothetical protein MPSEU_000091900 [Mayamaea pseudoterrestris]|nr:hypothetical protein MPSEU_000091900 [Mayamaea pseudoterrestris]
MRLWLIVLLGSALTRLSTAFVPYPHHQRTSASSFLNHNHQRKSIKPQLTTCLNALPLAGVATAVPALTLLAGIILIHESGHYLAARYFGMKVDEFSIGIGPKLFGFKAFGDEFNLRLLPFGGYVRFPENYNATAVRLLESTAMENAKAFDSKQELDAAAKLINTLTLGSIDEKRRKQAKQLRDEQKKAKTTWWARFQTRKSEDAPIPELLDLDDVVIDFYDDPDLLQNRPWFQRAVVISGGVIFNLLLAWSIYFGQINFGPGLPQPIFDSGAVVTTTPRSNTAANGLLRQGDVILSMNGRSITDARPSAIDAEKGISSFISSIRSTADGDSIKLSVLHPGDKSPVNIALKPTRVSEKSPSTIGVMLAPNFVKSERIQSKDIIKASRLATDYTVRLTKATAGGISSALTGIVKGQGEAPQVTGPIGLVRTGSEIVATRDWSTVLMFAAAISINLGVVNALPFPALDGGQLLFILAEAVTGRKVDQRVQEGLTGAAIFFLLLFSASAAIGDIGSLFGL